MPRLGRKASSLLLASLVVLAAALVLFSPVGAQGEEPVNDTDTTNVSNETNESNETPTNGDGTTPPTDGEPRRYTVRALDEGCPDGASACWDLTILPALPGDVVEVTIDLTPSAQPHNFHVIEPVSQLTPTVTGLVQTLTFTIPENFNAPLEYVCDVHPQTMVGFFVPPDQLGAATGGIDVVHMGVHFLAYWVGVIAFALLFIVYGATFFLFKYNETPATTDHWDRSRPEGRRFEARNALILAVLVAAVLTAAIIWLVMRQG